MVPPRQRGHDVPIVAPASGRSRRALGDPALHAALALVGFLVATWPFAWSQSAGFAAMALFLFVVWAAFVAALFAISRAPGARDGSGSSRRE